jgi:hypothetical protein
MRTAGSFTNMKLFGTNETSGALSNYTVTWIASIPMVTQDSLRLKFPASMKTPVEPICEKLKCINTISCSAEKGTIIAVLTITETSCLRAGANFTFRV